MATSAPNPAVAGANLRNALEEIPDSFLECRDLRHWWKKLTDLHIVETTPDGDLVKRESMCERCLTVREDNYLLRSDRWGVQRLEVLGSSYKYPDGYLIPAMAQADHAREILRFEQMRRALGGTVPSAKPPKKKR